MKAILTHLGAWAPMAEQKAVAHYLQQPRWNQKIFIPFQKRSGRKITPYL